MMIALIITLSLVSILFLTIIIAAVKVSGEISKQEDEKK